MKFLGSISSAENTSKNNKDTAVPFSLAGVRKIAVLADTANGRAEIGVGLAFASTANGRVLSTTLYTEIPLDGQDPVLAVFSTSGTTVAKVYALFR